MFFSLWTRENKGLLFETLALGELRGPNHRMDSSMQTIQIEASYILSKHSHSQGMLYVLCSRTLDKYTKLSNL